MKRLCPFTIRRDHTLSGIVCVTGFAAIASCPGVGLADARTGPPDVALGEEVYNQECASCHYDGERAQNAPPLKGSPALHNGALAVARIILAGQDSVSVVDGERFNGIMPAQAYLSDEEIADVTAYVRRTFGGIDEPLPKIEDVTALRAQIEKP